MIRVGIGHDTHRIGGEGPLRLGGIDIPWDRGLIGHSDADVLLHAVTDALLGAAGLGDIGEWFPDTAAEFAGADSARLLERVVADVGGRGWHIVNADGIVFAQAPKLSGFKPQLEQRIAGLLRVGSDAVNIKAKTGEHVGPIGRLEAMSAEVVVLIQRSTGMRGAARRALRAHRPRRAARRSLRRRPPIVPQVPIPQGDDATGQEPTLTETEK